MAELGRDLLTLARGAIEGRTPPTPAAGALAEPGATFVTLTRDGKLRGCIGSLEAWRPLAEDVRANARAAAFRDPRFPPLRPDEVADTHVEVSLLGSAEPLAVHTEADAVAQLRPRVDGVIVRSGGHRATFLPQVWDQLPDPHEFLAHLWAKAGLRPGAWGPDVQLWRYQVEEWSE